LNAGYTDGQIFEISKLSGKAGPVSESVVTVDFSYTIPVRERTDLNFGIKGVSNFLNTDYSILNIFNPNDALQQFDIDNTLGSLVGPS
jgi:hypothetical protein